LCENAVSFAIFYSTVTSRSWLTLEVDGDDDAALPSTESCRPQQVMVAVFRRFFGGFDSSILQGFFVGLVQNMRFRCGNLVKTCWKKTFQLLSVL
jgi:hypothetical protein